MKALMNDYQNCYEIIFPGNCDMLDVNNDCTTVVQMSLQLLCTEWLSESFVNNRKSMDTCIPV